MSGIPSAEAFGNVTVRLRNYFAPLHLWNARRNARLSQEAEDAGVHVFELRSQVLTTIFFAAAYLEGSANAIIMDTSDPAHATPSGIPTSAVPAIKKLSDSRTPLMVKFQGALSAVGQPQYAENRDPFKSARELVRMRNHFVHYKPEWSEGTHEYEQVLDAAQARWALDTAERFATSWWRRMRLSGLPDDQLAVMPPP